MAYLKTIPMADFVASGGKLAQDQFCQAVEALVPVPILDCFQDFMEAVVTFDTPLTPAQEGDVDAIVAAHTATGRITVGPVASLATGLGEGEDGYATDGRKVGEGPGAGTGVPIYWSTGAWRVYSTDSPVAA